MLIADKFGLVIAADSRVTGESQTQYCDEEYKLAHVPEKWEPVFRKGHAPINESRAHPDSTQSGCALVELDTPRAAVVARVLALREPTRWINRRSLRWSKPNANRLKRRKPVRVRPRDLPMTCKRWRKSSPSGSSPLPEFRPSICSGVRVRADHKPNSDIDVCLYLNEWNACDATTQWWTEQNASDFQAVKARLPRPLAAKRMTRRFGNSQRQVQSGACGGSGFLRSCLKVRWRAWTDN